MVSTRNLEKDTNIEGDASISSTPGTCINSRGLTSSQPQSQPWLPREFDIFGFYLSRKHALIALISCMIMFGPLGTGIVMLVLGFYQRTQRMSSRNLNSSRARRGLRWGGSGGNIMGVSDLPQDPKGG